MTTFPNHIHWCLDLETVRQPADIFSKKTFKKIQTALHRIDRARYFFSIDLVDSHYLDTFIPLYEKNIAAKKHGQVAPVRKKIEEGLKQGKLYEAVSLWHEEQYLGGLMYRVYPTHLSTAFKVFPYTLQIALPISPSFIAEWRLYVRALDTDKKKIIHGKDRNPYGVHSDVGLAMYKLQIGCHPYVSNADNIIFSSDEKYSSKEDMLVFFGEKKGDPIHEATLYTTLSREEAKKKYSILFSKPFLTTNIIMR